MSGRFCKIFLIQIRNGFLEIVAKMICKILNIKRDKFANLIKSPKDENPEK